MQLSPDQEGLGEAALGVNINHLLKVQQVGQQRPWATFVHLRHNNLQHKNDPNIPDDRGKNGKISVRWNESVPEWFRDPSGEPFWSPFESKMEPLHLSYAGRPLLKICAVEEELMIKGPNNPQS